MANVLRNPYEVLGIERSASADEIKAAYRRLALQNHPDRNPGDRAAEERFKEISEAYATLRDPEARATFDRYGSRGSSAGRPDFSTVDWQTVFQEADININWDVRGGTPQTGNVMFDVLFGYMTGMMRSNGLLPGEDRVARLELPLDFARTGGVRRVRIPGPSVCAECRGSGLVDDQTCPVCGGQGVLRGGANVDVTVPKGVRDGVKLRLKGLGGPGGPPGDALVTVHLRVPNNVRLAGQDLHVDLPLTPLEALRGRTVKVFGSAVKLPAGAKDGTELRVPQGGLAGGDLVVTVSLDVWRGLWRNVQDWWTTLTSSEAQPQQP